MTWKIAMLASWCDGELSPDDDGFVIGVSTDSRTLRPGELFVALRGEHFDGHDHVEQAIARGARALLVETGTLPGESGVPAIRVRDTVEALGAIARNHRERFEVPVVAITGSNGKTTTKEMCADILEAAGATVRRSPGNLNNHIGLPLSILALTEDDQALVVELGMNHAGEIDALARIAQPDVGAITQVAAAHLGLLGSLEAIALAKGELLDHVRADGTAVLNRDDDHVVAQRDRFGGRALWFGFDRRAEFRADDVSGARFELITPEGRAPVALALPGRHLIQDALCAAACAHATGLLGPGALDAMRKGLERFRGVPGRLILRETPGGLAVLDDSYNANPRSARAALETLAAVRGERRSLAVLGDMLELGKDGPDLHAQVGRAASELGVDVLIGVGPLFGYAVEAARAAGIEHVIHVDDATAAIEELDRQVRAGDVVLVKGSRGMRMERVVGALLGEL